MSDRSRSILEGDPMPRPVSVTERERTHATRRPNERPVMKQSWRSLLFLHWPISVEVLRPLIPDELEIDLFDGVAYVGLVPFQMQGVRPVGLPPVHGLSRFLETNVRTYVHHRGTNPGVWFFSLDAANLIAVSLARRLFHLPYYHARMFLEYEPLVAKEHDRTILYAGVRRHPTPRPSSYSIRARVTGFAQAPKPGTIEYFLAERYILYTYHRDQLYLGRVHHSPYPLQPADALSIDESLLAAAGFERPGEPPLAHFASGVDVDIFRLRRANAADI